MKRDLDPEEIAHLQRLENALFNSYDLSDVVRYLEEKTFLKGDRFSFKDHEFQETILSDTSKVVNVQKCAQVGMSEAMARYALAIARIMPHFNVILTMPFSGDAENFAKTRLDPIISDSPDLKNAIDRELDNTQIKGIVDSLLYMRGCSGSTAALSVPADMLIHDELDRSDPDIVGMYQSRIKHSKYKLTRKFGTPTLEGRGIALEMATSRRHRLAVDCHCCGQQFIPNFHTHVKVPGYNDGHGDTANKGQLKDITKYNLNNLQWEKAYLECPFCHEEPSLQKEHRTWVCENPQANFEAVGYYVTPFEVPNIVSIASLIKEITKYKTWGEFVNQALGETISNEESQLTSTDLENAKYTGGSLKSNEMHNIGIDVGQTCHIAVGRLDQQGRLLVVHRERCTLDQLKRRKLELKREYRGIVTVIDAFPETNMVHQMQKADRNLFGGVYHESRKLATYEIVYVEKDLKEGKLPINQAKIARNLNFDELKDMFKAGLILWEPQHDAEDDIFPRHCTDMTRTQTFNRTEDLIWTWEKSKEAQDHYFHALGYLHVACRLVPAVSKNVGFGSFPVALRLAVKTQEVATVLDRMR